MELEKEEKDGLFSFYKEFTDRLETHTIVGKHCYRAVFFFNNMGPLKYNL